jgi:hypothetical protein
LVAGAGDVRYREARIHGDLLDVIVRNILDAQHLIDREPGERAFDLNQRARRIGIRAGMLDRPTQIEHRHHRVTDIRDAVKAGSRLRQRRQDDGGLNAFDPVEREREQFAAQPNGKKLVGSLGGFHHDLRRCRQIRFAWREFCDGVPDLSGQGDQIDNADDVLGLDDEIIGHSGHVSRHDVDG